MWRLPHSTPTSQRRSPRFCANVLECIDTWRRRPDNPFGRVGLCEVAVDPPRMRIGELQDWRSTMVDPTAPRSPLESPLSRRTVLKGVVGGPVWPACRPSSPPAAAPPRPRPPRRPAAGRRPHPRPAGRRPPAAPSSVGDYDTDTQGEKDGMVAVPRRSPTRPGSGHAQHRDHSTFQDRSTSYLGGHAGRRRSRGSPGTACGSSLPRAC